MAMHEIELSNMRMADEAIPADEQRRRTTARREIELGRRQFAGPSPLLGAAAL